MKKLFFLIVMCFFVFSGIQAADRNSDIQKLKQETVVNDQIQTVENNTFDFQQTEKMSKKEFRKFKKELKQEKRKFFKTDDTTMMLVGAGLLIFGLLLYLVVTTAAWLGIAVMVLGLVLLLYGVLKRFF